MKKLILSTLCVLLTTLAYAQTGTLQGTIKSSDGELLPGATVQIVGTQLGRVTDSNGNFTFEGLSSGSIEVLFSFVGFQAQQQSLSVSSGQTTTIEITLEERVLVADGLVVTAQKRSQSIQEIPIPITNFEGEFLAENGIQQFDVLSAYVPGLQVQIQSVNNPGFVIRGITSDNGDSRVEPRVSVFQDGVSISKSRGSVVELFDMDRIETLKGPQGTLFGRGAQIGAVHLIQNKPKNVFDTQVTVGYGNFNELYFDGFVNAPIVEGKVLSRLAVTYNQRDGFIDNLSGGTLNGKETFAIRPSFRFLPSSETIIDVIFNYQIDTPPGTSFKSGTYAPAGGDTSPFSTADMERGDDLFIDRTVWGATGIVNHSLNSAFELKSITAFRTFDSYESFDADGTVAPALWFAEDAEGDQFSQEIRLSYNEGGAFSGFGGVSYFYETGSQSVPWEVDERSYYALITPLFGGALPIVPLVDANGQASLPTIFSPVDGSVLPHNEDHTETFTNFGTTSAYEAFVDGTYQITEAFNATGGLRFSFEDVTGEYEVIDSEVASVLGIYYLGRTDGNILFNSTGGERISDSETFSSWVGRLALDYAFESNTNVYAVLSKGRRPNVIQVDETGSTILDEEIVINYELGLKQLAFDQRLAFDLTAFLYDYSNFRTDVLELGEGGELVSEQRNSGEATALGFETSAQYVVSKELSIFANYAYIDATFDDEDANGNEQELAGNRFRLTPEHSASFGANFNLELDNIGTVYVRPNYAYKSQVFFEEDNQPGIEQDGYGLLNLRAGFILPNDKVEVSFYVENLLDEEYIIDAGNTGGAFGIPTFIAGPPRFVGGRLTVRM